MWEWQQTVIGWSYDGGPLRSLLITRRGVHHGFAACAVIRSWPVLLHLPAVMLTPSCSALPHSIAVTLKRVRCSVQRVGGASGQPNRERTPAPPSMDLSGPA